MYDIARSYISALGGIPANTPAFSRAHKILLKAAESGFVWPNAESVLGKIQEELAEIGKADGEKDKAHTSEEIGDLLSAVVTLICFIKTDPQGLIALAPKPRQSPQVADIPQMQESITHIRTAISSDNKDETRIQIHHLLTEIAQFAHSRGIDPEAALQSTNDKFVHRFDHVGETLHKEGRKMTDPDVSLKQMIKLWNQCKPKNVESISAAL